MAVVVHYTRYEQRQLIRVVHRMSSLGMGPTEIGSRCSVSDRQVYRWLQRPIPDMDQSWMAYGNCVGIDDPEVFFPPKYERADEARLICQGCPVRKPCLQWALDNGEFGVWGGLSEAQREKIRWRQKVYADE